MLRRGGSGIKTVAGRAGAIVVRNGRIGAGSPCAVVAFGGTGRRQDGRTA